MKPNQRPIDSIRNRISSSQSSGPGRRQRHSRRDQEAHRQRLFRLSMIGVIALVVVILAAGTIYEYMIKPNQVLAQVNGHEIRRRDYWKYQSVALYEQARTYESFAAQSQSEQQQQFLQFAASFDAQRADVWGSTDVSPTTLQQMVNDQLYLDGAADMGFEISDTDVQAYALNQFAPPQAPLQTPIPSPTMIPERAAMATETANAQATEQAIAFGTIPAAATPLTDGTPGATPNVVVATPEMVDSADAGTPIASPEPAMTLDESMQTANAEYDVFQNAVFGDAHLSEPDYLELWAKPRLARQLVNAQLTDKAPQVVEQVNAQHIMVATEDLARQLYDQATSGEDFSALARSNSTDATTASTGGQLGWFTQLEVSEPFGEAAFALQPGEISEPFQDGSSWHIVRVNEREEARPLTDTQYTTATNNAIDTWLNTQQETADISSDDLNTPTPTEEAFVAPPGAPTPIPATPIPVTPPPTAPLIGPEPVIPGATPQLATPISSGATPGPGDEVRVVIASPVASPSASSAG